MTTPNKNKPLHGKRIAITGAARGIGRATAIELHRRGAQVAIGDVDIEAANIAAKELGSGAVAFRLDVTDPESFRDFVDQTRRSLSGLDVLINNAGIMPIGPLLEMTDATIERAAHINLLGPAIGMRSALPGMLEQGGGHIINVSSTAGKTPVPGGLIYCAVKAGLLSLTDGARLEFGARGIAFTTVIPSFTNTELIAGTQGTKLLKTVEPEDLARQIADAVGKPKREVYAPKSLRAIFALEPFLGRRMREGLYRKLGAYDAFLEFDHAGRAAYDKRVSES